MNLRKDNRIVVDLKKVQFARYYYRNQYGDVANLIPAQITYRGVVVDYQEIACWLPDYPCETVQTRRLRRGYINDVWTPELLLKLSANHCLIYTGPKATSIYKTWSALIYG